MTDLKPITALGAELPTSVKLGALRLSENADLGLASLALRKGATVPSPFGLVLPQPGACTITQGIGAFWCGPDQWMVMFPDRGAQDVARDLKAQSPNCSVTEQTDGWCAFDILAQDAAALSGFLERVVNVNLGAFGTGCATRTVIDHMGVYLLRGSENSVTIIGMRSSAQSLWHALTTVAQRLALGGSD